MLNKKDKKFLNNIKNEIIKSKEQKDYLELKEILNDLFGLLDCDIKLITTIFGKEQIRLSLKGEIFIPIDLDICEVKTSHKVKNILKSDIIKLNAQKEIKKTIEKIKNGAYEL